ncbi:MarR family winged helix-turn-helix transcriptional regulator [Kangiella sp. TOML190]|uniref:MarR family winged helix-turn-helix transcriptional regulator n=1 Tax=Kangiella sp. TOML190 TaxID=2931351 RepID=UPI002041B38B|nr:MarR family transcriptional regulator [Kangiella sp. TOML190]
MSNLSLPTGLPEGMAENPTNQLANQLHKLAIHLLRQARKQDLATGLTPERLSILSILVYVGSKTVNQLATMEQVSAPAITRIVKNLEKDGYVIKAKSKTDQRVVYVSATRKSKKLMEQARKKRIEAIAESLESAQPQELTKFKTDIEALSSLLQQL